MKITHLNHSDKRGGASRAVFRINKALRKLNIDSRLLVNHKDSKKNYVNEIDTIFNFPGKVLKSKLSDFPLNFYQNLDRVYSLNLSGNNIVDEELILDSDIITLHWINNGVLSIKNINQILELGKPIVWNFHDLWPMTGGCHYSLGCEKYKSHCSQCPAFISKRKRDVSFKLFKKKLKSFKNKDMNIIVNSSWMYDSVKGSEIFSDKNIELIPLCLDTDVFKPIDKNISRDILNLPKDKKIILTNTLSLDNKRKGTKYIVSALSNLDLDAKEYVVATFGKLDESVSKNISSDIFAFEDYLDNYSLALLYNACDVFVSSSLAESFGQTYIEAMACKTPCVAFDYSGPKDIVDHKENGYLAEYKSSADLANGIKWVLNNKNRLNRLGNNGLKKVRRTYTLEEVGEKYLVFYKSIL